MARKLQVGLLPTLLLCVFVSSGCSTNGEAGGRDGGGVGQPGGDGGGDASPVGSDAGMSDGDDDGDGDGDGDDGRVQPAGRWITAGGGHAETPSHRVRLSVGAPVPMGSTATSNDYQITVGPIRTLP